MNIQTSTPKTIFLNALDLPAGDQRQSYLAAECGHDAALRAEVESLLQHHRQMGKFLEASPAGAPSMLRAADSPLAEGPGSVIGPYKLLEQIGEGGMGVVFMAEQTQPVQRKVALKIVKPGMDTKQVIARFEAERQALAMMDHPNIAKVLDAGTTGEESSGRWSVASGQLDKEVVGGQGSVVSRAPDGSQRESASLTTDHRPPTTAPTGRPYFVMELVRGVPITEFCDQHKLTIRERLELFVTVCQAVQHAHQKGIIHRDLKPTNVLVTLHDTKPVVKVIDFGVAKATGQKLTEKTLFTGLTQMIGTPLYMSPEQAEMSGLDVDTRSDIYSLGVLLYELLTGSTPFEAERLKSAPFDELRRIIREEEPPRPSTRISSLSLGARSNSLSPGERAGVRGAEVRGSESAEVRETANLATTVADRRRIDPRHLSRMFQRELDWIVMKCLEKDRNRRYETAGSLAADVEHYLADEPVEACPPSAMYRIRKSVRRNKVMLVTITAVMAASILGMVGTSWQAIRATHAEREAKTSEQSALDNAKQAAAVAHFLANVFVKSGPISDGKTVNVAELLDRSAMELQLKFRDDLRTKAALLQAIGVAYGNFGMFDKAIPLLEESRNLRTQTLGPNHPDTLSSMQALATFYGFAGMTSEAIALMDETLERRKSVLGPTDPATIESTGALAELLERANRPADAARLAEIKTANSELRYAKEEVEFREAVRLKPNRPDSHQNLGKTLYNERKFAEAEAEFRGAIRLEPDNALAHYQLGYTLAAEGRYTEAELAEREAIRLNPDDSHAYSDLSSILYRLQRYVEAEAACREAIRLEPENSSHAYFNLEGSLQHQGKLDEAETVLRDLIRSRPTLPGAHFDLSVILIEKRRYADAEAAAREAIHLRPRWVAGYANLGIALSGQGKVAEAEAAIHEAVRLATDDFDALISLSNFLANCQDPSLRDAPDAVRLAQKATKIRPQSDVAWQCLGWAQYRSAQWQASIEAQERSCALQNGGDEGQWLYLAMAHWQLGHKDEARKWFDRAAEKMEKNTTNNEDMIRARDEASDLLKSDDTSKSGDSTLAPKTTPPDS
jgi:serine/threonine protein kinase/tetratricopeptide (TPR) repeat protein